MALIMRNYLIHLVVNLIALLKSAVAGVCRRVQNYVSWYT